MPFVAHKVVIESVSDASGLAELIDAGAFAAADVVAVIGKTEGNGGVNDFTRILADQAFRGVLRARTAGPGDAVDRIPMVWSGRAPSPAWPWAWP